MLGDSQNENLSNPSVMGSNSADFRGDNRTQNVKLMFCVGQNCNF